VQARPFESHVKTRELTVQARPSWAASKRWSPPWKSGPSRAALDRQD